MAVDELKQWQAMAGFVSALPDTTMPANMIPDIPAAYQASQNRLKITP
jgi:hypothetical protein